EVRSRGQGDLVLVMAYPKSGSSTSKAGLFISFARLGRGDTLSALSLKHWAWCLPWLYLRFESTLLACSRAKDCGRASGRDRIRDIKEAPDGSLYLVTEEDYARSRIVRIVPNYH